jgi:hypothetical protein
MRLLWWTGTLSRTPFLRVSRCQFTCAAGEGKLVSVERGRCSAELKITIYDNVTCQLAGGRNSELVKVVIFVDLMGGWLVIM